MNTHKSTREQSHWKTTVRSVLRFFGFVTPASSTYSDIAELSAEASPLSEALLTVRMALNPGETVATAAPRIHKEALRFDEFLANGGSIGRIVLRTKKFDDTGFCKSWDQYGVKDPDEVKASIWHRLKASGHTVLDFVVFDEADRPMFSILRTYSNWTGNRTCDLGDNRIFYLNMVEATEPGYVNVWAGFSPASAVVTSSDGCAIPRRQPIAAVAVASAGAGGGDGSTRRPLFRKLSPALITLAMGMAFVTGQWVQVETKATEREAARENGKLAASSSAKRTDLSSAKLLPTNNNDTAQIWSAATNSVPIPKERVLRLAEIRHFRISVNKKSCDQSEGRCLKLLGGLKRNLKSRLDGLNLPVALEVITQPATLIVSYQQTDSGRKLIHLDLCDHEGSLWNAEHGLDHEQDSDVDFVNLFAAQFSTEVLVTVMRAKDQIMSEGEPATAIQHEANVNGK